MPANWRRAAREFLAGGEALEREDRLLQSLDELSAQPSRRVLWAGTQVLVDGFRHRLLCEQAWSRDGQLLTQVLPHASWPGASWDGQINLEELSAADATPVWGIHLTGADRARGREGRS